MQTNIRTVIGIASVIAAMVVAKTSFAQTDEERRAAAQQRAQEGLLYISNLMAQAQADAQQIAAQRARHPRVAGAQIDPEVARMERYAREFAPWIHQDLRSPTAQHRR